MSGLLHGTRVAVLATDGVEQAELERPRQAAIAAGARVVVLSVHDGPIQAVHGDIDHGDLLPVDRRLDDVSVDQLDLLVLPGGTVGPDRLRADADAVEFVRTFVTSGKPVAAISYGPWMLAEADVVHGRTLTSSPQHPHRPAQRRRRRGGPARRQRPRTDHQPWALRSAVVLRDARLPARRAKGPADTGIRVLRSVDRVPGITMNAAAGVPGPVINPRRGAA